MKICFKTADGLLCVDHVECEETALWIARKITVQSVFEDRGFATRKYARTGERLAGVPIFEEVP
ncbi:MAG: hypothetical protein WBD81_17830 [Collimonas pratensis]|uniref:hypothetical protein n=1 Tax=Collimonas pratensis TaxID=279113 RepID=UPI003C71E241